VPTQAPPQPSDAPQDLPAQSGVQLTVTANSHVAVSLLPSVAVHVTGVVPSGKLEPEGGLQAIWTPPQLSVAVAAKETIAEVAPGVAATVIGAGHCGDGSCPSSTVTENEHWVEPTALVAVQVTEVAPRSKLEPLACEQETVSAHVPAGTVKAAVAPHVPTAVDEVTSAGQVIDGRISVPAHVPVAPQTSLLVQGLPSSHDSPSPTDHATVLMVGRQSRHGSEGWAAPGA
jgi:hypothetical protein